MAWNSRYFLPINRHRMQTVHVGRVHRSTSTVSISCLLNYSARCVVMTPSLLSVLLHSRIGYENDSVELNCMSSRDILAAERNFPKLVNQILSSDVIAFCTNPSKYCRKLWEGRVEKERHVCNKFWNRYRFSHMMPLLDSGAWESVEVFVWNDRG